MANPRLRRQSQRTLPRKTEKPARDRGTADAAASLSVSSFVETCLDALRQMPPQEAAADLSLLLTMREVPAPDLAANLRLLLPKLPAAAIAKMLGVDRSTLYTWPEFRRATDLAKERRELCRGSVDADGNLDSWTE